MQNSKTLLLLRSLSTWERKNLQEYVFSPFFNKNERVCQLWDYLEATAPEYTGGDLERHRMFEALFPGEAFEEQKLRYLLTDLNRLAEGFMAYKVWEQDTGMTQQCLLQAFEARELVKPYEQTSKKLEKSLSGEAEQGHAWFNQRFFFTEKAYQASRTLLHDRGEAYQVGEVMGALDELFLVKKLRYSCELINQSNVLNKPYEFFLTEELVAHMARRPDLGSPLARLYFLALRTLQEEEEESHYYAFRDRLETSTDHIAHQDLSDLYTVALNYCVKKLNLGKGEFTRELFRLYQTAVEKRVIFVKGLLPLGHFKNIVTLGARLKDFDWTEQFIEDYRNFLPPEETENAYLYNLAYLQDARGNYPQVKRLLMAVEFTNVFYQLGSRAILIRTYYELEDYEALLYLLGSFRIYLRRNRSISDYQRRLYLNLVKVVRQMVRFQLGARVSVKDIRELMDRTPDVAARQWVEEKIGELVN